MIINTQAFSRVGLMGNPSDGYYGKTVAAIMKNFGVKVTLYETPELEILPASVDHNKFNSLDELVQDVRLNGYYGGVRLIKATLKRFAEYCEHEGVELPRRNFTVRYVSDIPRQVGLGGSSAIICAILRALLQFYEVHMPKEYQPSFILGTETVELQLSAGLQDRVIQVYEGLVYMDFAKQIMDEKGRGHYEPIATRLLPPLFAAYRTDLRELSTIFHTNLRERFQRGDEDVVDAMRFFAECTDKAREGLLAGRPEELGELMDQNFDMRDSIYPLDRTNKEMVMIARRLGAHAKFAGSGGAVVGTYTDEAMFEALHRAYRQIGCEIVKPIVD